MKLNRRLSGSEVNRRVDELLKQLSLKKCENTRIGRGISGGERKRLFLASEVGHIYSENKLYSFGWDHLKIIYLNNIDLFTYVDSNGLTSLFCG